jgi:release factor glutamine methyltransferase
MLTYREALTRGADQLSAHPDLRENAFRDATELFLHAIGISRALLMAHPERRVDREQQAAYQRLLERRLRFEPMQYIFGETEFFGHTLRVTPAVLIPRPETELLVEAVIARLRGQEQLHLVDIGTGSGAIAIALASALGASVTAVDLSPEALAVARQNAQRCGVSERIEFVEGDLLGWSPENVQFDAIVSNPPYVPQTDAPTLHPQVRDHEPASALFAGADGLEIYRRLIPQAYTRLMPGGLLALEIGYGQKDALAALLAGWKGVEFLEDLQAIPRVALATVR